MGKVLNTILSAVLLGATPALGQIDENYGEVTIEAQMRDRAEMRHGQGTLRYHEDSPVCFVNQRSRIGINWERNDLEAKVAVQHVGVWGDEPLTGISKKGNLGCSEAWAKYIFKDTGSSTTYVQLGRQVLSYDDERLLGANDWSATGCSHDAMKLAYESNYHKLQMVVGMNQNEERATNDFYDGTAGYKNMQMLWYRNECLADMDASLLLLNIGMESGSENRHSTKYMQTMGVFMDYHPSKLPYSVTASFYYQRGENRYGLDVNAFMASVNGKYAVSNGVRLGVGADYISGTSKTDKVYKTFNLLYGTHHSFYGAMDYFDNVKMPLAGLVDVNANAEMKIGKNVSLDAEYHYFRLAEVFNYKGTGSQPRRSLGHEVDFSANWQVRKYLTLQAGYSVMFPLRTMGLVKATGNTGAWQHWGWLTFNLNPTIFKKVLKG